MKTLHLIRHAKSSWQNTSLEDAERPLKKRGIRDARLMAPAMWQSGWRGGRVYCSSARRARDTLQLLVDELHEGTFDIAYDIDLYTFDYNDLLDWLSPRLDDELTLVGHNPALLGLVEWFTNAAQPRFPTGAYARLHFAADSWSDCDRGSATLEAFIAPKRLK